MVINLLMLATVRNSVRRQPYSLALRYSNPTRFQTRRQHFSTSHFHPTIRDFARTLAHTQPCVSMSADDVNILSEPAQFYDLLLVGTFFYHGGMSFSKMSCSGHDQSCPEANIYLLPLYWFRRGRLGLFLVRRAIPNRCNACLTSRSMLFTLPCLTIQRFMFTLSSISIGQHVRDLPQHLMPLCKSYETFRIASIFHCSGVRNLEE